MSKSNIIHLTLFYKHVILQYNQNNMKPDSYIKANRKGSREAELENSSGWTAVHKIHKSNKTYTRKIKHKNVTNFN